MYPHSVPLDTKDENPVHAKAVKQRSTLVSRNVTISGHRTSVRLEPEMWSGLTEICRRERANLHAVCSAVAQHKDENTSLTAAIRVFVMAYYRAASTEDGHTKAGHGYGLAITAANMAPGRFRVAGAVSGQPASNASNNGANMGTLPMQQRPQQHAQIQSPYLIGARAGNVR